MIQQEKADRDTPPTKELDKKTRSLTLKLPTLDHNYTLLWIEDDPRKKDAFSEKERFKKTVIRTLRSYELIPRQNVYPQMDSDNSPDNRFGPVISGFEYAIGYSIENLSILEAVKNHAKEVAKRMGMELIIEGSENIQASELSIEESIAFLKKNLRVDGLHTPSDTELVTMFEELDTSRFSDSGEIINTDNGRITIKFNSLATARILLLKIIAEGRIKDLFYISASEDLYKENLIDDFRISGDQLSYLERESEDGTIQIEIYLRYKNEYKKNFTNLIRDAIYELLPNTKRTLDGFSF